MKISNNLPGFAAILAAEKIAISVGLLGVPGGNKNISRIGGINHDMVQHHFRGISRAGKARPTGSIVRGEIKIACAGAKKNPVWIFRINSQAAHRATIRA